MALPKRIHADELISVHGSIGPTIQGIQYNTIPYTIQETLTGRRNCSVCTLPRPLLYCIVGSLYTDKKENKFSSYMRKFRWDRVQSYTYMMKGFLTYEEMRKFIPIYEEAVSHI
jgi:hypothetical protein